MLASILSDFRYALRQMRRSPGFALAAIAVLALGLGANIAVFSLVNGILLRPLPYANSDRLVKIELDSPMTERGFSVMFNYSNMQQLRDATGGRMPIGASFDYSMASIVGPGGRMQVQEPRVDAAMLSLLSVQPILGRGFREEETQPGREHVVVLSDSVWQKLFHGDRSILGKPLTIRGESYTIVGIMPRGFSFPFQEEPQIWTPQPLASIERTSMDNGKAMGGELYARLPEGMTVAQLAADLNRVQPAIAHQVSDSNIPDHVKIAGLQESMNHQVRKPLLLLYAVVFGLWALACLNVTSLMLARAVSRQREQAVRSALGARRLRLLQQAVVESLLLSCLGALVGLLLAQTLLWALGREIKRALPLTHAVHLDWRVAGAMALLTLLTAALTGLAPALAAARRNLQSNLHGVTTTASAKQNRTREMLVVAQLALTVIFLVGAGLFLRTIHALRAVPLGFGEQNVLTGGIILNATEGASHIDESAVAADNVIATKYQPLLDRLRAMPGVRTAALSSVLPLRAEFAVGITTTIDHKESKSEREQPQADGRIASAGLTEALGIPMLRGRFFSADDTGTSPPVVVVNQAFANKYLPGQDPVGHVISMAKTGRFHDIRIVGVIGDVKQTKVTEATTPELYFCLAQTVPGTPLYGIARAFIQVAIRAAVPASTLKAQFDRALHEVAPDATTTDVKTMHEAVEDSFGSQTLTAYLLEGFAALALMIASVGLYGLLSFAVAQRTREIGLRIALGAPLQRILGLVLNRALALVAIGLALGSSLAWFAVRLAGSYLYGVKAHDAVTFIAVVLVLAAAAFLAAWLPARRAAQVDPILALRSE
jgi:predicted permease